MPVVKMSDGKNTSGRNAIGKMPVVKMSDGENAIGKNAIGKKCQMVKMSDGKNSRWWKYHKTAFFANFSV